MEATLKDGIFHAFAEMGKQEVDEWVAAWPGQATYVSSQLWFALRVRTIFQGVAEGRA